MGAPGNGEQPVSCEPRYGNQASDPVRFKCRFHKSNNEDRAPVKGAASRGASGRNSRAAQGGIGEQSAGALQLVLFMLDAPGSSGARCRRGGRGPVGRNTGTRAPPSHPPGRAGVGEFQPEHLRVILRLLKTIRCFDRLRLHHGEHKVRAVTEQVVGLLRRLPREGCPFWE